MKNGKKPLNKILLSALAAVMLIGNSVPAFAASDVLANGYSDLIQGTKGLSAEQNSLIPEDLQGYEINEDGEYVIPADQFNPEGWDVIEMDVANPNLRSMKYYEWYVPANTYCNGFGLSCKSGNKIAMTVDCDYTIQAGIIEPDGSLRCVVNSGIFSHTFALDQTGTYHFYVKNTNNFEIYLEASVAY